MTCFSLDYLLTVIDIEVPYVGPLSGETLYRNVVTQQGSDVKYTM